MTETPEGEGDSPIMRPQEMEADMEDFHVEMIEMVGMEVVTEEKREKHLKRDLDSILLQEVNQLRVKMRRDQVRVASMIFGRKGGEFMNLFPEGAG